METIQAILGNMPIHLWLAAFFFYMLGAMVYQYTKIRKGVKKENGTPTKFDFKHYFSDEQNYFDFAISVISAYLFLRFGTTLLPAEFFGNEELFYLSAVALGMSWQFLADRLIKKLNNISNG